MNDPRGASENVEQLQELVTEQRATIEELETPVIQLWDRVLLLPLVGALDTSRAQKMTEALLERITESGSDIVIMDLSGVGTVDTAVARHLVEAVSAARLLGAEVTIVGISSRVATAMVQLGINIQDITTRATLKRGLEAAFAKLGLAVLPMHQVQRSPAADRNHAERTGAGLR